MIRPLLIASLVLGASCDKDKSEPPKTEPKAETKAPADTPKAAVKPPANKPAQAASEYVSKEHKFSVMANNKPRTTNPPAPAGSGPITSYMFSSPNAPGAYMILVATVPLSDKATDAERKKAITDGRDSVVKKYGAAISSDKEIKVGDHPGRDFSFSASHPQAGEMVGRSKMVVRGSELFQVMRVGERGAAAFISEADVLIDSFKFTE